MDFAFSMWQDYFKKKACRYILHHYLGQFLEKNLTLDQLSVDLSCGEGTITRLNLDVQAINEGLETYNIPVELLDGYVDKIFVAVPWSTVFSDSARVEISGLELTLRPKQREDNGMIAGEMWSSMQSNMTSSLQLAKGCIEAEEDQKENPAFKAEPIEGVQKFAGMIDSVLAKVRVSLFDTIIRLEHQPQGSPKGVAMEIRTKRFEYFDELASVSSREGTSVDSNTWEPAAFSEKNFHVEGIQLFFDEVTTTFKEPEATGRDEPDTIKSQMFQSTRSTMSDGHQPIGTVYDSLDDGSLASDLMGSSHASGGGDNELLKVDSNPIQVAVLTGRQEIKLRLKQSDTLQGPKLEIICQFGGLHILLSPRQLHGMIELFSSISSPASSGDQRGQHGSMGRQKPMSPQDYQVVEEQLQQHLQTGRIQSNNLQQMHDFPLYDDQFFSLMSPSKPGGSEMESSFCSTLSGTSNRSAISSIPSSASTAQHSRASRPQRDPFSPPRAQRYQEDPASELSHYQVRLAFFSLAVLHNNLTPGPDTPDRTWVDVTKEVSQTYFKSVGGVMVAGRSELKDARKQFARLLSHDHLRMLGKPLSFDCTEKSARKQITTSVNLTVGIFDLVENLYETRTHPSSHGLPNFIEILTFKKDVSETQKMAAMYSSMQGGAPCLILHLHTVANSRPSSRPGRIPCTDITILLGELQIELDLTLMDRINSLITVQKVISPSPLAGMSMYQTGNQFFSMTQTLDEGASSLDHKYTLQVTSSHAKVNLRFPIPDLRQESHVDKSWYQRNLRDEILTVCLSDARCQTTFTTNQSLEDLQITCAEAHGYFRADQNDKGELIAHVTGEGGEEGFNHATFTLKFCDSTMSVLSEENYSDTETSGDSLNGACQFNKVEPSPFSSQRSMQNNADNETEQMVIPADRFEQNEFMQRSMGHTKLVVEIVLPNVCLFLPSKHMFELLYNRFNNDLLLWEPSAPSPKKSMLEMSSVPVDLNVYTQLLNTGGQFEMTKSGLQQDSDTDSDTDSNPYSIHDTKQRRKKRPVPQKQSTMCLNLNIGKGRLTGFMPTKDSNGVELPDKHGEVLVQLSDLVLFTEAGHNGDPNLQYVSLVTRSVDLYHQANVENTEVRPIIDCSELSAPVPPHLQHNHVIYRSEPGVIGEGYEEEIGTRRMPLPDMLFVGIKIRLGTKVSKRELISDEMVKDFLVSVGVQGATMRHRMALPYQNVFVQLIDYMDVKDYPILGYIDPKVLTELHVHLWKCAVDYRPIHLPLRSVLKAESFSLCSNIVAESSVSLLRFVLEDGALFLSKKLKAQRTDLQRDYVCVLDVGSLKLALRSYDKKDEKFPATELQVSNNRVNLRTCADSFSALIQLIEYLAKDGDLQGVDLTASGSEADLTADIGVNEGAVGDDDPPEGTAESLSSSSYDHVHNMMADAMQDLTVSDPELEESTDQLPGSETKVYFTMHTDQAPGGSPRKQPIVITHDVDPVMTSAVLSPDADSNDGYSSDDFCMIDDISWGKVSPSGDYNIRDDEDSPTYADGLVYRPVNRTDFLKAPDHFPMPSSRYILKELTLIWNIYGGSDFVEDDGCGVTRTRRQSLEFGKDGVSVSYNPSRGSSGDRWSGQAGGREAPPSPKQTMKTRGGSGRDMRKCTEIQLSKVRFQYDIYPNGVDISSRQVFLVNDIEIRDRLTSSKINKLLYRYSCQDIPQRTFANMVYFRATHFRLDPDVPEEECYMKVSLQPIRLNVDQDTMFFMKSFITDVTCLGSGDAPRSRTPSTPPPVMCVNMPTEEPEDVPESRDLLMQFDELATDLQASIRGTLGESNHSDGGQSGVSSTSGSTVTHEVNRPAQPVFIKEFEFSPEVLIRLDYNGKFDSEHGTVASFGGLLSLKKSELKLKRLSYKQGLLGMDKMAAYCMNEWLTDIRSNQIPSILSGVGPMNSIVTLVSGIKDLFWMPVEQYRKDGRIVRGIQKGASSFTMSSAMSLLELTNRVVVGVQWCAECTFDMVSPGPRTRTYYPRQPSDMREGVTNAYHVLKEGISTTATNMVDTVSKEHEAKGVLGAVGGVLREIPPTIVQPLIVLPEATSNLLDGLRRTLKPDERKEDGEKWKDEVME